jgi:hypothetical protein
MTTTAHVDAFIVASSVRGAAALQDMCRGRALLRKIAKSAPVKEAPCATRSRVSKIEKTG